METYDVVQVGYGPVGLTMAALLGQRGHRVAVCEQYPSFYPLPRAGAIDDEIMRIFQSVGAADEVLPHGWPLREFGILDANREPLYMYHWSEPGPSGWHGRYLFHQPELEKALDRAVRAQQSVEVHQSTSVVAIEEHDDHVLATLRDNPTLEMRSVKARYVIGADGANSLVREIAGIEREDFGFSEQWLVIDLKPHDPDVDWGLLPSAQICDPKQPITAIRRGGRTHARFEVMLVPGQTAEEMERPETGWALIEEFGPTPKNADMVRNVVYRFESLLAERFGQGRLLLVGDAAHVMPPFLGQGMCSGLRDAITLAWRLDLVLRDVAPAQLLDSYTDERRPHVEALTRASMALGEIVCTIDEQKAAARDAAFRSGQMPDPRPPFPGLTAGVLAAGVESHPTVGRLSRQGRVRLDSREGRFDDVAGVGWRLLLAPGVEAPELDATLRRCCDDVGLRVVPFAADADADAADAPGVAVDVEGTYAAWFAELDTAAVLVRPDFYVFGVAASADEAGSLLDDLCTQLLALERRGG